MAKYRLFTERQASGASSDNEWQRVAQRATASDKEWQQVTMNDIKWQQMAKTDTTMGKEWQWVVKQTKTNNSKW